MPEQTDFSVVDGGSVALIVPQTQNAQDWVGENISEDRVCFGDGFGVEPRYLGELLAGIEESGLSVSIS